MIHCGSRGLGHQICSDHVRTCWRRCRATASRFPTRNWPARPVDSPEGRRYLGAMAAAANYGRANRQLLTQAARSRVRRVLGSGLDLSTTCRTTWPSSKPTSSTGERRSLCVHRKGATRAWPPGHSGPARRPRRVRPAGARARVDGHRVLRARRRRRRRRVPLRVSRRRADDEPTRGDPPHPWAGFARRTRSRRRCGARLVDCAGSPRRHPSPTRTSTRSLRPASTPGWPAASCGCARSAW